MPSQKTDQKVLKIKLVRSMIGYSKKQKATAHALGLKRINQTVEHVDSPAVRGMISKIEHLVSVEE